MTLGNWRFAPKAWALMLYVSVLLCMLWLANWQLDRAALKVSLQQSVESAQNSEPVPVQDIVNYTDAASTYQRVKVSGSYDANRQFLWDNRSHKGQAGFEVISIMALESGERVLINRGWVAPGASRQDLPDVRLPGNALMVNVSMQGIVSRPSQGFASGSAITGGNDWPKLLQYFDYEAIAAALGEPVLPVVVQAQTLGTDAKTASVLTSRPEWLKANWQPAASGPAKHYSYAFQWFAMALALTGIFLVVNTQKVLDKNDRH